jgi:hypothetical protein
VLLAMTERHSATNHRNEYELFLIYNGIGYNFSQNIQALRHLASIILTYIKEENYG